MTGFKPGSSGIGSDRSANCVTTTAQEHLFTVNCAEKTKIKNDSFEKLFYSVLSYSTTIELYKLLKLLTTLD